MTALAVSAPDLSATRFELSCGARLLVASRPGAPVTAMQVHLRGGHSLDAEGLEGTAFLAGSLLDSGTRSHSEDELDARLEGVGGTLGGDARGVGGAVASAGWRTLAETLCEVLTEPAYPNAAFQRERGRLLARLGVELEDPRAQAARRFRDLVYGDHWIGRPERGTPESVEGIERRQVAAFHRKHWCASRALIAVCGDVDPRTVKRFFEKRLAHWRTGSPLAPRRDAYPPLRTRTAAFRADRQQVHVYLGHLGTTRTHADYPALVVMDHILGMGPGFANRVTRILRDELGLAYSVSAGIHNTAGILRGMFTAYIGTSPEHVETAVKVFLAETRRIQRELVTDEELALVKSYLTGSFVLGFERAARRSSAMIFSERCGLPQNHLEVLLREIGQVTAEDVRRVATAHLHPEAPCLVASGPIRKKDLDALVRS